MDNDEYFSSYMASLTSSRSIIRSALNLLERQDDMLRLMYLNWGERYEEETESTSVPLPVSAPAPLRRRTGLVTHNPVFRNSIRNSTQSPLNTRFNRGTFQRQEATPPARSINLDNNNQPIENNIANIFAQAILNSIGNVNQLSPVIVRPSQRTIELATENMFFSEIPASIDRYQQCPISQDNFQPDTPITRIRRCGHYFERDSIATWFQTSCRCPICRADIREGVTDDATHNEEVVDESDDPDNNNDEENTNNDSGNAAEENTNNYLNTQRNQNITDILNMISSTGETNNFPGATISYQLEFVPVVQNVSSPNSSTNTSTSTSWLRRARNNIVSDNRTTISPSDSSGNNFSL